jgi:UDP-N-acetylmuramoylalanine--D-glutamate ligase
MKTSSVEEWSGKRVLVIGAARQGLAAARFLARAGSLVVINDRLPPERLREAQASMAGEPVSWVLGDHPLSLLDSADLVCVSGGVPLSIPLLREAKRRGIPLTNDADIFLRESPCRVIGVTGSAGKTTTTTLVARMAFASQDWMKSSNRREGDQQAASRIREKPPKVWVGGNIGTPLITALPEMAPDDLAVMELSSFQLELVTTSPRIAAVLNVTPNHLDRHGTMEDYLAAKARILAYQTGEDTAVLNRDDEGAWSLVDLVKGDLVTFGFDQLQTDQAGTYFDPDNETIMVVDTDHGAVLPVLGVNEISLRGRHNLSNVLAACAIALAAGISPEAMADGVRSFNGIPHRLEFVRRWRGSDWYNDSIATAPERAIAAIQSFDEPLVLLAGGRDKNLPWDGFAALVHRRVKHLILFGEAAEKIAQAMIESPVKSEISLTHCASLAEAVQAAARNVSPGDVVLLSPGGTSFDEFRDFEDRGEAFKKWVMELP